ATADGAFARGACRRGVRLRRADVPAAAAVVHVAREVVARRLAAREPRGTSARSARPRAYAAAARLAPGARRRARSAARGIRLEVHLAAVGVDAVAIGESERTRRDAASAGAARDARMRRCAAALS